jgi:hypothetical protein
MALSLRVVNQLQRQCQEYHTYTDEAGHQERAFLWKSRICRHPKSNRETNKSLQSPSTLKQIT